MITGDPSVFAIESGISKSFENPRPQALGFFNIHIAGRRYGVYKSEATMLANSFDSVQRRIADRGKHTTPFALEGNPSEIADSFRNAIFSENPSESFFGIPSSEFCKLFSANENDCAWAPDGDEAFDDGSYVLQFDVKDRVRLVAFKSAYKCSYDPNTLSDVWLAADDFYDVLRKWSEAFETEWRSGVPHT
jgi:hypothetical protein